MMLSAQNISVRLGRRDVLKGVDAAIGKGKIVAVIGPNGAGKSTLLRAMAGLLPLQEGRVILDGHDVAMMPSHELGRQIAYLPQDRTVHWPVAVERVVRLGRLPHVPSARDDEAVASALAAMDLGALASRPVTELSGGELARVLQARALAQEAPILIADEPAAGLDMAHVLSLFEHFKRLSEEGRSVLVALHDVALALRFCDKTVLLKDGSVLAAGATKDVVTPEEIGRAFGVEARIATLDHVPIVLAARTLT
ncbi:MAG: ABC transporter ATP-binding protein [Hyphomicrobiaceae bacterium]|nr:ABC transporter ATP-binding protein [Hyphomicrobiaceae bacterium]